MRRAPLLALLTAALVLALGSCADGEDVVEAGGLQGVMARAEPEVQELPEERTTAPPGAVVVDHGAGDPDQMGYEHSIGSLSVLGDDRELDELAAACFGADLSSCDVLYDESPGGSLYEAYGATCGARLDEPTHLLCVDELLPPAQPWEDLGGGDPFLDELAKQCHDGDLLDCDLLFAEAERGTQHEAYGATCGFRLEGDADSIDQDCTEAFPLVAGT